MLAPRVGEFDPRELLVARIGNLLARAKFVWLPHSCGIAPCGVAYSGTKYFINTPQMGPNDKSDLS